MHTNWQFGWHSSKPTDSLTDSLAHLLTVWLTAIHTNWQSNWQSCTLTDSRTDSHAHQLTVWLTAIHTNWQSNWQSCTLTDSLTDSHAHQLTVWLTFIHTNWKLTAMYTNFQSDWQPCTPTDSLIDSDSHAHQLRWPTWFQLKTVLSLVILFFLSFLFFWTVSHLDKEKSLMSSEEFLFSWSESKSQTAKNGQKDKKKNSC